MGLDPITQGMIFSTIFATASQGIATSSQGGASAPIAPPAPPDVAGGDVPQADAAKAAQKAAAITRMSNKNTILTSPLGGLSSEFVTSNMLGG